MMTKTKADGTKRAAGWLGGALCAGALLACAGTAMGGSGGDGSGPSYTIVVLEGDVVGGVGAVTRIDNLAVNNAGEWVVEADTDNADSDADQVALRGSLGVGSLLAREGEALGMPMGALLDSFDTIDLNDNGEFGWNLFLDGTSGSGDDSGIYFVDSLGVNSLVLQEGFVSGAESFSAGTPYIGFFDTKTNDSDQILVIASVDDPAINSSVDRALVLLDYDSSTGMFTEEVLAKEGDLIFGSAITDFETGPHDSDLNDNGDVIAAFDTSAATSEDTGLVLYSGGSSFLLALEGQPSPVMGRNWGSFGSTTLDLANNGTYFFRGDLDGSTSDDAVLVVNEGGFTVFQREGGTVPASVGGVFSFTSFGSSSGPVKIGDNGRKVWFGDWDDPDTSRDTALFVDLTPVLWEGVTTIDGFDVVGVSSLGDGFDLSENGRFVIAEVDLLDPETGDEFEGAVLIDLDPVTKVACLGDIDGSGAVDALDLGILLADFGCNSPVIGACPGDLTGDGIVNSIDLGILLGAFGDCPEG